VLYLVNGSQMNGILDSYICWRNDYVLFSVPVSGSELWNDSFISSNDMEGSYGCNGQ
jgi:hypothetical protein